MIRFKQIKINRSQAGRVKGLISLDESEEKQDGNISHLVFHFDKMDLVKDMGEIIDDLNSNKKEDILKTLNEAGISSDIEGNLEQFTSERIQRIIELSDLQTLQEEYPNAPIQDLIDIQKVALKNLYRMLTNCENFKTFDNFSEFDFSYLINELPIIYVPLIFSIILKQDPELPTKISSQYNEERIKKILPEYDENIQQNMSPGILFIFDQFKRKYELNEIEVYSIIQLIALLFQYSVVSEEEASIFINVIIELCSMGREYIIDSNYLKFFLYDFINKLNQFEHFQILSETNFFSESTKHFTILSIMPPKDLAYFKDIQVSESEKYFTGFASNPHVHQVNESKFIQYLQTSLFVDNEQNIDEIKKQIDDILSERDMNWKFHSESLRLFFLDTVLKFLENGFIEKFIEFCFPDLFNFFTSVYENVNNDEIKIQLLSKIVLISNYAIQFSEECRSEFIASDFHKMMKDLNSFREKVFVLNYLSFFIPFDFDNMILLSFQFDIPLMCYDMMFGDSKKGILAALDIFSLFIKYAENAEYGGTDLIQNFGEILTSDEMIDQLEELLLEYESDETNDINLKIQNLLEFLKKILNGE